MQDLPGGNVGPTADDVLPDAELADGDLFEVENGVLTFAKSTPPTLRHASASTNNFYQGGRAGLRRRTHGLGPILQGNGRGTGPGGRGGGELDRRRRWRLPRRPPVDELLEFQADAVLTATVTDPDGPATIADATTTWQWYRSTSRTGGWTDDRQRVDGSQQLHRVRMTLMTTT